MFKENDYCQNQPDADADSGAHLATNNHHHESDDDRDFESTLACVVPEAFSVNDEDSANWVVRKIVEARRYAVDVERWAASEIRRAEREERFFLERYGAQLEGWVAERIAQFNRRRKSVALPSGTVGFRTEPVRVVVSDENALLAWCRRNQRAALKVVVEAVGDEGLRLLEWHGLNCREARVSQQCMKSVINRHVIETGEHPDGCAPGGGEARFYVK